MKIGLLIIATEKYTKFIQPLIESADKHFLKGHEVTYFVFSNKDQIELDTERDVRLTRVEHMQWPYMTLFRYKFFTESNQKLSEMDYLYYCDADMLFVSEVGDEILSDLVATIHPGYLGGRGTPETRPQSLACVFPHEQMEYYAGGFNGGTSKSFLKMSSILSERINEDMKRGIIAIWHDESHMNRYMIDHRPTKVLDPSYCHPESWNLPYPKRLLALDKNHSEIRS
jgi:histo-blood group ABO system transferase